MAVDLPSPRDIPPLTIVGAGKLGRAVGEAWEASGGEIQAIVSAGQAWKPQGLVFEATRPDSALDNILKCVDANTPVVTGTTGWLEHLPAVSDALTQTDGVVFWSTNFSPGVHVLNQLASYAANLFSQLGGYEARIEETHHLQKVDAPSGTALTLKQHVAHGGWPHDIQISSKREGKVVGLHTLTWESVHDSVVLQHEALSRLGFAQGAVMALRYTWAKRVQEAFGLYTMKDLFKA